MHNTEKLRKSKWSLADCCVYAQHVFEDQPWLLRETEETNGSARKSHVIMPSIQGKCIMYDITRNLYYPWSILRLTMLVSLLTQWLHKSYYPGSSSMPSLVKLCGRRVQISDHLFAQVRKWHLCIKLPETRAWRRGPIKMPPPPPPPLKKRRKSSYWNLTLVCRARLLGSYHYTTRLSSVGQLINTIYTA